MVTKKSHILKQTCFFWPFLTTRHIWLILYHKGTEAVVRRCSAKKVFLIIKKETLTKVLSCKFCEIYTNTFRYRTPLVAASEGSFYSPQEFNLHKIALVEQDWDLCVNFISNLVWMLYSDLVNSFFVTFF